MTIGPLIIEGSAVGLGAMGAAALSVAAWLVWNAVRQSTGKRRVLRVVLSLAAVVALLFIGLRPEWAVPRGDEVGLLLTDGSRTEDARRLADSLGLKPITLAMQGTPVPEGIEAETVPDVGTLARQYPEIGTLYIAGYGLPRYALSKLPTSMRIRAAGRTFPIGIGHVWAPRTVTLGTPLRVQGQVRLPGTSRSVRIVLSAPGGPTDSLTVDASSSAAPEAGSGSLPFNLRDTPRAAGTTLYDLAVVSAAGDTLAAERVGVSVVEPEPVRLLVLQGAPRFETRYLKNWVADQGGRVIVRSQISENQYRTEFVNRPRQSLAALTSDVLASVDLVMADRAALERLSAAEQGALRRAVAEGGMGLLLGPDVVENADEIAGTWAWLARTVDIGIRTSTTETEEVALRWAGRGEALPAISTAPYVFDPRFGQVGLTNDAAGRTRAYYQFAGQGRVGVHGAAATFRWRLRGEDAAYAAYWSHLFEHVRHPLAGDRWRLSTDGPVFVDEPVGLIVETNAERPVARMQAEAGGYADTLYVAQDVHDPQRWTTTFWPRTAGWHHVQIDGGAPFAFFVHGPGEWQAVQQQRALDATSEAVYTSRRIADDRSGPPSTLTEPQPIPLYGFFAVFVLSAAGLWAEQRFRPERQMASA